MECSVCYKRADDIETDIRIKMSFITLPCEATQYSDEKHVMCFPCFITNHTVNQGVCPVCRDNYMHFVNSVNGTTTNGMMTNDEWIASTIEYYYVPELASNLTSPLESQEPLNQQALSELSELVLRPLSELEMHSQLPPPIIVNEEDYNEPFAASLASSTHLPLVVAEDIDDEDAFISLPELTEDDLAHIEECERLFYERSETPIEDNYCTACGIPIGVNNPRQLCEKTFCPSLMV